MIGQTIEKLILAASPILWGLLTWFLIWGPGSMFIPDSHYPIKTAVQAAMGFLVFGIYYASTYNRARDIYRPTFFGISFAVPPWWLLIALAWIALAIGLFFAPLSVHPFIASLIMGVMLYPCIEELIAHTLFVKYTFSVFGIIFWSLLNAYAFMLMHRWYANPPNTYETLWSNGHFGFGLLTGLITYKTGRIEVAIIIHMLSNLLRYTLPVLVFNIPLAPASYFAVVDAFFIFCVAFLSHKINPLERIERREF